MTEDQQQQSPKDHKSIHEMRNQDLVSRLLAATPPYLYTAPVGPNNFFFSDMLRSLVQARNSENARTMHMQQASIGRRPRKRSWSQHRPFYDQAKERKDTEEKIQSEKPLELTNKQLFPISSKYSKSDHKEDIIDKMKHSTIPCPNGETKLASEFEQTVQNDIQQNPISDPPAASLPPSELVLPPPPPVWYPPIYPPYGIDPLHFFIDLRVSGHIYDRKKENMSPLANADNNNIAPTDTDTIGKYRHGSAFTVPTPRNDSKTTSAINLSATSSPDKLNNYAKYYDIGESKENQLNPKNTNYVLQNLPRIYTHLTSRGFNENGYETENKSDHDQDADDTDDHFEKENSNHIDVEVVENVKISKNDPNTAGRTACESNQFHQID